MKWTEVHARADRHLRPVGFGMDRPLRLHSLSAQLTAQADADKDREKYSDQGLRNAKKKGVDERVLVGEEKRNAAF